MSVKDQEFSLIARPSTLALFGFRYSDLNFVSVVSERGWNIGIVTEQASIVLLFHYAIDASS